MTTNPGVMLKWPQLLLGGAALIAVGVAGGYLALQRDDSVSMTSSPASTPRGAAPPQFSSSAAASETPLPDVTLTLSADAIQRAGVEVALVGTVGVSNATGGLRVPGLVQPHAYKTVKVTPVVGGRLTRVLVELGQAVTRGQTLAEVYSPELSAAQTQYLSTRAALDAHERQLRRTEKLVEIGAASQQELEQVHAEHTAATTMVETARSRLTLLGLTDEQIVSLAPSAPDATTMRVPAPIDGVVTERLANAGVNVDAATALFTVVDLSTVWVVGSLYEKDFAHVRVGSRAIITTSAFPDRVIEGRVSYIDPQVNPDTRAAQIRVEVPNRRGELKLGMYADLSIGEAQSSPRISVLKSAVQMIGDRTVVYLASPAGQGRFVEREVRLGDAVGDRVEVISGLEPGDRIVTKGSFSLRAERERLGLRPPSANAAPGSSRAGAPNGSTSLASPTVQTARVVVSDTGYEPSRVALRAGVPARITFVRTSDKTCGTEVTFPSLDIRRALPLNQPVDIELTPQKAGDLAFICGMGMLKGTIVVQ